MSHAILLIEWIRRALSLSISPAAKAAKAAAASALSPAISPAPPVSSTEMQVAAGKQMKVGVLVIRHPHHAL